MKQFFIALLIGLSHIAMAQNPNNPPQDQGLKDTNYDWSWKQTNAVPFTPPPPDPIPIDGGVGFLLVAGAGIGVRELKKRRKK